MKAHGDLPLDTRAAIALMVVSAFCYSASVVVARDLHDAIAPMALVFVRCCLSAALLAPFVWRRAVAAWPDVTRHGPLIVALALTQAIIGQGALYVGLQSSTAVNAGLINTTLPFFAMVVAALFGGERPAVRQVAGLLVAAAGVVVVAAKGDVGNLVRLEFGRGDLWILLAMASWGIYAVLVKKTPAALGLLVAYLWMTVAAAGLALPLYVAELVSGAMPTDYSWRTLASIAYIATLGSIVALVFWNAGIRVLGTGPATAGVVLLQPVITAFLAAAALGEAVEPHHWWAGALIIAGVYLGIRTDPRRRQGRYGAAMPMWPSRRR